MKNHRLKIVDSYALVLVSSHQSIERSPWEDRYEVNFQEILMAIIILKLEKLLEKLELFSKDLL